MRQKISLVAPVVLLTVVFGALVVRLPVAIAQRASDYSMFDPVIDVQRLIADHFFRELEEKDRLDMQRSMIEGMIEVLDDRYTEYIPTENIADFDKAVRGEYAGIGAEVIMDSDWLKIVSPMEGSPAFQAGIEADDFIVAIAGQSTWRKDINDVIDMLMGPPGTEAVVTIERSGESGRIPEDARDATVPGELGEAPGPAEGAVRFDISVQRQRILASTIRGVHRNADEWLYWINPAQGIAMIRVTQFTGSTIPELSKACRSLVDDGMQGLVLDLRFNGGGSLFAAIQMADLFLDEGLIVSTRGRDGDEENAYARQRGTLPDFPMIVLVNGQSASASEIVAGALQDNGRAAVLGERSFGKGVVQSLYRLPSGAGQLKITEQYYYLPSGRLLHRKNDSTEWGVDPNDGMYVPMTNDEYGVMFRVRRQEEIIHAVGDDAEAVANWADTTWILDHLVDKQLSAAIEAINGKLETNLWPEVSDELDQSGAMQFAALEREERRLELLERELLRSRQRVEALASAGADREDDHDLIPVDDDLTGGKVEVFDSDGNPIATLAITGPNLEAWLNGAPLEPVSDIEPVARNEPTEQDDAPGGQ